MTREEAIKAIQDFIGWFKEDSLIRKALEMAIQALSQEPCDECKYKIFTELYFHTDSEMVEQQPCDDAVSRDFVELVIEYPTTCAYPEYKGKPYYSIKYRENGEEFIGYGTYKPEVLSQYLKEYFIPSVTQKSKTGHWITTRTFMHDGEYYCDRCKCDAPNNEKWDFCPNCGARMVEPQERSDKE